MQVLTSGFGVAAASTATGGAEAMPCLGKFGGTAAYRSTSSASSAQVEARS